MMCNTNELLDLKKGAYIIVDNEEKSVLECSWVDMTLDIGFD